MKREREEILKDLANSVLNMDEKLAAEAAQEVIGSGLDAYDAISNGLVVGMNKAGDLYETEEYFVPEILICSDAMYAGLEILRPHLKKESARQQIKCVIGVVEGDTHDIGKNLVKIMLEASGFEVHDLGRDIPPRQFAEKAKEVKADIIAISTLMTTAMRGMSDVINVLKHENIRERFKVMVGGGPIFQGFADSIGADGYAANAGAAVKLARKLLRGAGPRHDEALKKV